MGLAVICLKISLGTVFGLASLVWVKGETTQTNQQCDAKPAHLYPNASQNGIIQVNANELEELLATSQVPVMVEFYATWCGDCQVGNVSANIYLVHSFDIFISYYHFIVQSSSFVN